VKITPQTLREMKRRGEKIAALTAYDFSTAQLMDAAGIPVILVGDSLGMVVLGYENTLSVTMAEMLHHVRAVARAKPQSLVVADMPVHTYETVADALKNATQFVEAGADAVKLEGAGPVLEQIQAVVQAGIPVLGHIGLLPQSAKEYKVVGRTPESATQLRSDAKGVEAAGAFGLVVECVVAEVARQLTAAVSVPTIGIGAGAGCDGQILVSNDMLGQFTRLTPKHVKRYASLAEEMRTAFIQYKGEVQAGTFPSAEQSF
jgi:3-methyl-2-oxobutanoate hydroxymethyltransferase